MIREEMESTDYNKNKNKNIVSSLFDKLFGMWGNWIDLYEILKTDTYTSMVFRVQRRWKWKTWKQFNWIIT